ncbi:MAG TPA: zf-HC2 domain-containing protein, partial [Trebonia sp.]
DAGCTVRPVRPVGDAPVSLRRLNEMGCAWVADAAAELALGVLPGRERAGVLAHLDGCGAGLVQGALQRDACVCGPPVQAAVTALRAAGIPAHRITVTAP